MRVGLFSDIHSNVEALRACLAHARERGVERHAFLGDLVGYGADPAAIVEAVRDHASRGAIVVKGNHDEAVGAPNDYLNEAAARAIAWTRGILSPADAAFLAGLPLCHREAPACYVHASASHPERWPYVDSLSAAERSVRASLSQFTFSGHVHAQVLYSMAPTGRMIAFEPRPGVAIPLRTHRACLALVGSVGQPRDGNPAAAYAIADFDAERITFHRVPYDNHAAARKIREAGLPESLAFRLERGI
jgi:diadenosine tetraphosphatase ApaH/serine/threonine PP2A family protein phosphatase